jgi:ADP-ribosylglycohydrolase
MAEKHIYKDLLLGVAVGDALGVPVEFQSRELISKSPVADMIGYGTYNLPPGTFSDDSSLTFCLAEALTQEFNLQRVADNFVNWLQHGYWTADGHVFDVGIATSKAIDRLQRGFEPEFAGGMTEFDNGNGSLMRILPLVTYLKDKERFERFELTKKVSSITHRHIRSVLACFYYLEFARKLLDGATKFDAYDSLKTELSDFFSEQSIDPEEVRLFGRLLAGNIHELPRDEIKSGGYVVHTLEASIWCLLTTDSYASATLKAVNLGEDTDTTAAVTGGLAGLLYGFESIPAAWLQKLARRADIEDLADRLRGFHETE